MRRHQPGKKVLGNPLFLWLLLFCIAAAGVLIGFQKLYVKFPPPAPLPKFYRLPSDYTKVDLIKTFLLIRQTPEYKFYFLTLSRKQASAVLANVSMALLENRTEESLLKHLQNLHGEVESLAKLFYYLEYSPDFYKYPDQFPGLENILQQFVKKDFELTVLEGFYKATYQPAFSFKWDKISILASYKAKEVVYQLHRINTAK